MLHLDAAWVDEIAREAGGADVLASTAVVADPAVYRRFCRLNALLFSDASRETLADVAHGLGFADQSHFQRVFKAHVGVTPRCYRGGAAISFNTRRV